jgi:hypothetical protein
LLRPEAFDLSKLRESGTGWTRLNAVDVVTVLSRGGTRPPTPAFRNEMHLRFRAFLEGLAAVKMLVSRGMRKRSGSKASWCPAIAPPRDAGELRMVAPENRSAAKIATQGRSQSCRFWNTSR